MLTTEPALRPYSGPNWLVMSTYCATNSESLTNNEGPPTLLSLLFWPSISWSLLRPRRPFEEKPAPPLVLENELSRTETIPGTKSAGLSRPSFSCTPANVVKVVPEKVELICDWVVSISGASALTSTEALASPTAILTVLRLFSTPAVTCTLFWTAVLNHGPVISTL